MRLGWALGGRGHLASRQCGEALGRTLSLLSSCGWAVPAQVFYGFKAPRAGSTGVKTLLDGESPYQITLGSK